MLTARFEKQVATASVDVTVPPLSLKAEPAGPLTLPVGEMLSLRPSNLQERQVERDTLPFVEVGNRFAGEGRRGDRAARRQSDCPQDQRRACFGLRHVLRQQVESRRYHTGRRRAGDAGIGLKGDATSSGRLKGLRL